MAVAATKHVVSLLQDSVLIGRNLATVRVEDPTRPTKRIPTGTELAKLFNEPNVIESEITSEAETAWLYGDAAAAEGAEALTRQSRHAIRC